MVSPYDFVHPGGVNNHVANLSAALRDLDQEVTIIAPVARDQAVPDGVLPISRSITTLPSGGSQTRVSLSVRAPRRVKQLLERESYDVVHLHNPLAPVVCASFVRHREAAPNTAMVATVHEYRADKNPLFSISDPVIQRWMDRLDGRIAVSEMAREFNNTYFPGAYTVIPNGIDAIRYDHEHAQPLERYRDGRPTVLFLGRLEYRKGFRHLLRAWPWVRAVVPKARLLVVGAYEKRHKRQYVRYARQHDIHGLRFVGRASEEEKPRYYRSADVYCAPAAGFESFGIVLLEAMAAGVPVVASDIPGFRTVLDEDVQGVFAAPRNQHSLALAIINLLQDPERRARLGRAGQAKAALYDWSRIAVQVLEFYGQVLAAPRHTEYEELT